MAGIESITDVQIELGTGGVDQRSFSRMALVIPYEADTRSGVITEPDMLLEAPFGLSTTSDGYKAALAAYSQNPGPTEIVIGRADTDDATPAATMAAITAEDDSFYGFADVTRDPARAAAFSAWGEAHKKLHAVAAAGGKQATNITTDIGSILKNANYFRTFTDNLNNADDFSHIGLMAKKFASLPGSETWAFTTLAGVTTEVLSPSEISNLKFRNMNYYTNYRNLALSMDGRVAAGEWIDIIRFRDWLEEEIRVRCFSVKIDSRIPYDDTGIAIFGQAIHSALDLGVRRGGIVADYPNEKGNGTIPGFTISLPRASTISNADKRARVLRDVKFEATLRGAIHAEQIRGRMTYNTLPSIG